MKRVLLISIIILLLGPILFISAQDDNSDKQENILNEKEELKLEKDIELIDPFASTARVIFNIKGKVYLSQSIILLCLFLLILVFLFNIVRIIDFPGGRFLSISAVLITVIIGSSAGGLTLIGNYYLKVLYSISLFEKWPVLGISLSVILFIFLIWLINLLSRFSKKDAEYDKGYKEGLELNKTLTILKRMARR
jgi:magnesium-transporting ATPase (P-type)